MASLMFHVSFMPLRERKQSLKQIKPKLSINVLVINEFQLIIHVLKYVNLLLEVDNKEGLDKS